MYCVLPYQVLAGVNDANVDMVAVATPNFTRRGGASGFGHFILTEPYQLLGAMHIGASATDVRTNVASLNPFGRHHVWPVNRSATVQSDARVDDYREFGIPLPINEEIALEESGNLGAATEQEFTLLFVGTPDWSRNLPAGEQVSGLAKQVSLTVRFTATIVVTANAWSGEVGITFLENIKGGVYAVVEVAAQAAGLIAFYLNFPRMPLYRGRKLLPGFCGTQALGDQETRFFPNPFGELGRFHTFEPPNLSALSIAGGGTAIEGRMRLVRLGDSLGLLGGGGV